MLRRQDDATGEVDICDAEVTTATVRGTLTGMAPSAFPTSDIDSSPSPAML